jgi:hypothetical protein
LSGEMELKIFKIVNPRVPVDLGHQSEYEIYNVPDARFDHIIENSQDLERLREDISNLAAIIA